MSDALSEGEHVQSQLRGDIDAVRRYGAEHPRPSSVPGSRTRRAAYGHYSGHVAAMANTTPAWRSPVQFSFDVGEHEHFFRGDQYRGAVEVRVDGRAVVDERKPWRMSLRSTPRFGFEVGKREKHQISDYKDQSTLLRRA